MSAWACSTAAWRISLQGIVAVGVSHPAPPRFYTKALTAIFSGRIGVSAYSAKNRSGPSFGPVQSPDAHRPRAAGTTVSQPGSQLKNESRVLGNLPRRCAVKGFCAADEKATCKHRRLHKGGNYFMRPFIRSWYRAGLIGRCGPRAEPCACECEGPARPGSGVLPPPRLRRRASKIRTRISTGWISS